MVGVLVAVAPVLAVGVGRPEMPLEQPTSRSSMRRPGRVGQI
jgi:hypothetical protein